MTRTCSVNYAVTSSRARYSVGSKVLLRYTVGIPVVWTTFHNAYTTVSNFASKTTIITAKVHLRKLSIRVKV